MDDDEYEIEDEYTVDEQPTALPGITAWSICWNLVAFTAAFFLCVAQFWNNVAGDIAAQDRVRREKKAFKGSVEAGIESLMVESG